MRKLSSKLPISRQKYVLLKEQMLTLGLSSIDRILQAEVHTAGSNPTKTPAETQNRILSKRFVSSALMLCEKDTRCTKYQKNSCGLSFRAVRSSWCFSKEARPCYIMMTQMRTPSISFHTHLAVLWHPEPTSPSQLKLNWYKNGEILQGMVKSGLKCYLNKLICTFCTEIQDFLQTIVYAQQACSRFQQGHILMHSLTTSHLGQQKCSPTYSPSVQKTPTAAVTVTPAALLKKSHQKHWNLITHWEHLPSKSWETHRARWRFCTMQKQVWLVYSLLPLWAWDTFSFPFEMVWEGPHDRMEANSTSVDCRAHQKLSEKSTSLKLSTGVTQADKESPGDRHNYCQAPAPSSLPSAARGSGMSEPQGLVATPDTHTGPTWCRELSGTSQVCIPCFCQNTTSPRLTFERHWLFRSHLRTLSKSPMEHVTG